MPKITSSGESTTRHQGSWVIGLIALALIAVFVAASASTDYAATWLSSAMQEPLATALCVSIVANFALVARAWALGRRQDAAQQALDAIRQREAVQGAERAAFAEQLRTSEERLRLANQAAGIGTFIMDLRTGRVTFSPESATLLGFAADSEPTIEDAVKQCVHPDDLSSFQNAFFASLDPAGSGLLKMDIRIVHPDGTMRWLAFMTKVEFLVAPEGPKPFRQIGTCMDVTERKQAQELLARSNSELEQKVAERTSALETEMQQRIEVQAELAHVQRLEAVGQLTGGLAHDFNNLLTVVSANLELAAPQIQQAEARSAIQNALDAVEVGATLNRRLLAFARQHKLEPELLVINERVQDMATLLTRTLGETITLRTVLDAHLWVTRIDPGEIDHAVLNIALNARDAMPNGGNLTIETRNVVIGANEMVSMTRLARGDYVHLSFADSGTGMTPEVCARAVEPFFTTKEAGSGSGLGLSSVYGFVKQSGGHLRVTSEVGVGTTIGIYLPRAIPDAGAPAAPRSSDDDVPMGDGQLVLVVEDNARVREATVGLIEGLGYAVLSANSGPEAIALIRTGEPVDLLFSDVVMPGGMSGHDLANLMSSERPGTRILMTSGFNANGAAHGDGRGAAQLLRKPYSRARLARALREAFGDPASQKRRTEPTKT